MTQKFKIGLAEGDELIGEAQRILGSEIAPQDTVIVTMLLAFIQIHRLYNMRHEH